MPTKLEFFNFKRINEKMINIQKPTGKKKVQIVYPQFQDDLITNRPEFGPFV